MKKEFRTSININQEQLNDYITMLNKEFEIQFYELFSKNVNENNEEALSDLIKLKIDKEKLVDLLKNFLCVFDKNYNKNAMISYKDNMDVFILAKVMEMNEKGKLNLVFEILYNLYYRTNKLR